MDMQANELVGRVREALADHEDTREVKMFGGVCFMLGGAMAAGASPRGLLVRVGKERHAEAVSRPGAQAMEMRGRPMPGYVIVDVGGLDDRSLHDWLALARAYVGTLPPKTSGSTPKRRKKG
jgi:hypothetical protein